MLDASKMRTQEAKKINNTTELPPQAEIYLFSPIQEQKFSAIPFLSYKFTLIREVQGESYGL